MGIELEVMNVFLRFKLQTPPDTSLEKGEEDEGEETAIGWFQPMVWAKKTSRNLKIDVTSMSRKLENG